MALKWPKGGPNMVLIIQHYRVSLYMPCMTLISIIWHKYYLLFIMDETFLSVLSFVCLIQCKDLVYFLLLLLWNINWGIDFISFCFRPKEKNYFTLLINKTKRFKSLEKDLKDKYIINIQIFKLNIC